MNECTHVWCLNVFCSLEENDDAFPDIFDLFYEAISQNNNDKLTNSTT